MFRFSSLYFSCFSLFVTDLIFLFTQKYFKIDWNRKDNLEKFFFLIIKILSLIIYYLPLEVLSFSWSLVFQCFVSDMDEVRLVGLKRNHDITVHIDNRNMYQTRCVRETQIPSIMVNSKYGQNHMNKYFDTVQ